MKKLLNIFLALVLSMFNPIFSFFRRGPRFGVKRKLGQKNIFERSKRSFNKFRTSAKNKIQTNLCCSIIIGIFLFITIDIHSFGKKTIFGIRSQGLDGALELAGWQQIIYKYDQDSNYGTIAAAAKYTRSIRPDQISNFLFGASKLRFSGSRAERKAGDILADYLGLSADFSSTVCFSPHISNTIIDFDWFQAFDASVPG